MQGHGRLMRGEQVIVFTLVVVSLLACLNAPTYATDSLATENLPVAWQDDAELTDIHFVNATTGWAVGAQGVILRTTDGGKNWLRHGQVTPAAIADVPLSEKLRHMRSGTKTRWTGIANANGQDVGQVRCRLESICFIDSQRGWVAGGYTVPWLDRSRGVILQTADGGVTWHRVSRLTLPAVTKIHFQNRRTGWAIGATNQLHPTGVYYTSDGGRTWTSNTTDKPTAWRRGGQTTGGMALVDHAGRLASLVGDQQKPPALFGCTRDDRVADVAMVDDQVGYAAGPSGLLMKTDNGGAAWRRLKLTGEANSLPIEFESLNFSAVTIVNQFAWLSLADSGRLAKVNLADRSVELVALPGKLPVRKLVFASETHGYAIADFGTILATIDGGNTWQRQRGTHDRVAMLVVASRPQDIPLSVLAIHAGEENRICGTVMVTDFDETNSSDKIAQAVAASQHAFERVGSSVNWRLDAAGRVSSDRTAVKLSAAIRTLRPLVIVCCEGSASPMASDGNRSLTAVTKMAIRNASMQPSDTLQSAWQVERLVNASIAGSVRIDARRMLPSLGRSAGDAVVISRAILGQSLREAAPSAWLVEHPGPPRRMDGDDFLSGLGRHGHRVPTRQQRTALGNLKSMNQVLAARKRLQQISRLKVATDRDRLAWQQEVQATAMPMESDAAGQWLADLAEVSLSAGDTIQAADALQLLATRWPNHGLAAAANAWLSVYYGSAEAAVLGRQKQSRVEDGLTLASEAERMQVAAGHLGQLGRSDPAIALEPAVQWLESRLLAQSSDQASLDARWNQLARLRTTDGQAFAVAARSELNALKQNWGKAGSLKCVFASERPQLDGRLDDAIWGQVRREGAVTQCRASGGDTEPTDEVYFARDEEFFYAAYRCSKRAGQSYGHRPSNRPRDPDLSRRDRVELRIDTDRDFASTVTLVVDHRGWAADSALGNTKWNPQWYVAQAEDADAWTVEFAIPLESFVELDAVDSDRWAIRLDRVGGRGKRLWQSGANALGAGRPNQVVAGLRAGLLPDPRGFQILRVAGAAAAVNDSQVKQAQFQLELPTETNVPNPTMRVPKIPQLGDLP